MVSFRQFKNIPVYCLIVFTVLYYFLRFSTGLIVEIASLQALFLVTFAFLGLLILINSGLRQDNGFGLFSADNVVFLVLVHSCFFLPYIFYRDSIFNFSNAVYSTILPLLAYFAFSKCFSIERIRQVCWFILFITVVVALIYFIEYLSRYVFFNGPLDYSMALNQHAIAKGSEGTVASWSQGVNYRLERFGGPVLHYNSTALIVGIGLIISIGKFVVHRTYFLALTTLFLCFILFLIGARTALFSVILSLFGFCLLWRHNWWFLFYGVFIAVPLLFIFLAMGFVLVIYNIVDLEAYSNFYNFEGIYITLQNKFGNEVVLAFLKELLYQPWHFVFGMGFPSFTLQGNYFVTSIMIDDLFFLSIISRYGLIIPIIFIIYLVKMSKVLFNLSKNSAFEHDVEKSEILTLFCVIIAAVFSTIHTDAMFKPQILPIIILAGAFLTVYTRKYTNCRG